MHAGGCHAKALPHERLVRRRLGRRDQARAAAAHDLRQACGDVPTRPTAQVAALEDACWHRLVPLSKGRLEGDTLVCGYHGLKYNAQGRCTFMPSQETINPSACVRAYPVVERHRFIWLWMGDPALADPALVPDMHWNHDPAWAGDGKTIHVKCDYRLVVDNLMDLTHETFVHGSSIGNDAVAEAPFDVTHGEKTVTVTRWMKGIEAPPFWAKQLQKPGPVDRWQIIRFEAPCTVNIDVGVAPAGTGAPEGDRSQGVNGFVLNTITPGDRKDLPLFLGLRAQPSPDRAAPDVGNPRRRFRHLP